MPVDGEFCVIKSMIYSRLSFKKMSQIDLVVFAGSLFLQSILAEGTTTKMEGITVI